MEYKFFAFISYRHTDIRAAKKLQGLLEGYNLPTEIKARVKDAPKRFKVFRDTDELTSGVLGDELRRKLDESKFLIVICSPNSAQSKYVGDEIAYFRSKGRDHQIIPFIIDGVPHSERDCFHPQLTLGGLELLGIDVQAEEGWCEALRFHRAFIRTVAKMLGLDFGVLWNKRRRQLIRRAVMTAVLTVAVVSAVGFFALRARQAQPFDLTLSLHEAGAATTLPLRTDGVVDTLYLYLDESEADGRDVRPQALTTLNGELLFKNIPGRYRDKPVRIVCESFACHRIDTTLVLTPHVELGVSRDPEPFGRIRQYVMEEDGVTPAAGAEFDFGCVTATTDGQGLLDVLIPLEYQQPAMYEVSITYKGQARKLRWQEELDPLQGRTEISTVWLDEPE